MPEIGIAEADEQIENEESEEQPLDDQEEAAMRFPICAQLFAPHPCHAEACHRYQSERQPDGAARIRDSQRPAQPREIRQQRESEYAAQRITALA